MFLHLLVHPHSSPKAGSLLFVIVKELVEIQKSLALFAWQRMIVVVVRLAEKVLHYNFAKSV